MSVSLSALVATAKVVSIPLRTKFRGLTERELMIFEGPNGFTEWAAFPEYSDEEASVWLRATLEWGFEAVPKPLRTKVLVNAILPAVKPEEIQQVLTRQGTFETIKIKVAEPGENLQLDLARVIEAKSLYPEARLRLDANGGYEVHSALKFLELLKSEELEIEYFEQPAKTIAELAELKLEIAKRGLGVKTAADESVRKSSDPLAVAKASAADYLVLKSAPLGGINSALAIAKEANLPVIVSSAMQSSVGLAAELHFACSISELNFDSGLGTMKLFVGDLVKDPLYPENGELVLRRPEINSASLDTFKAEDHRADFWFDRLERCARILNLES